MIALLAFSSEVATSDLATCLTELFCPDAGCSNAQLWLHLSPGSDQHPTSSTAGGHVQQAAGQISQRAASLPHMPVQPHGLHL